MTKRFAWICLSAGLAVGSVACGGGGSGGGGSGGSAGTATVRVVPNDGAGDVPVSSRVTVTISRPDAEICRFAQNNTTFTVKDSGGADVAGSYVYFVEGLRVDFTASGMFENGATYTAEVKLACADLVTSTFTTRAVDPSPPLLQVGMGFRIVDLTISEPSAMSDLLRGFLSDAALVVQVLATDPTGGTLSMLGGEGTPVTDDPNNDPFLTVFMPDAFLFPLTGVYKPPYFQIEGRLEIPVNNTEDIVLERFEISGRFVDGGTDTQDGLEFEIVEAAIRASAGCNEVCQLQDNALEFVCNNRNLICDANDVLNLIGNFSGAPNDIEAYQTITITPDGSAAAPVTTTVDVTLTHPISSAANLERQVVVRLTADGSTTFIDVPIAVPATDIAADGLSVTLTPVAPLAALTTYTVLVVAHKAQEFTFTTQ